MLLNIPRAIVLLCLLLIILGAATGCAYVADVLTTTCAEARTMHDKYCKGIAK